MPTPTFNYNNWQFWVSYNPPLYLGQQKVTFWGEEKLILVNQGVTSIDFRVDVYSAWKEWLIDPNHINSKWPEAIASIGGDPLPGSRQLGTTYFLENGWRMRTWEGNHELTVTGNVFTREGQPIFVPTINPWTITINLNTSTLVETILPSLSLGSNDIDGIAAAVWSEVLSGSTAGNRLISLATAIQNVQTSVDSANTSLITSSVWNYIIDNSRSITAANKLKQIATKTQDIALG